MESRKDKIMPADLSNLNRAREWIAQLYQSWGKTEKEAEWKPKGATGPPVVEHQAEIVRSRNEHKFRMS